MNSIYIIAEEVKRKLDGGDPTSDSSIDIREVIKKVRRNLESRMKEFLDIENRNRKDMSYLIEFDLLKTYTISLTDKKGTMVVRPLSLNQNMGIYEVRQDDLCNETSVMVPMQATKGLTAGMESSDLGGLIGYRITGRNFEAFHDSATPNQAIMDIVPSFMDYPENDDYPWPGVVEEFAFDKTYSQLYNKTPEDIVQDNTDRDDWKKHQQRR